MDIGRASSSIPLVSPRVEIDGVPYLDGGIADSIPLIHAMEKGWRKNVVVLTRNKGYRKSKPGKVQHFMLQPFASTRNFSTPFTIVTAIITVLWS